MKHLIKLTALALLFSSSAMKAQSNDESTGLPGDQFSLEGALEMFKKAASPEEFEKMINTEGNHVNNLDLNGDGDIDYVKVIDNMDGEAHALVLQVAVSANENQDIAVIEIEKEGKESAVLQIIGDEEIYGESLIIEPTSDDMEMKKKGPSLYSEDDALIVNVWLWPSVRYVYAPVYRPWVSPFRWAFYPTWWRPWHPLAWNVFHPFRLGYRVGYAMAPMHRVVRAHRIYTPVRMTSVTVNTRNRTARNNYQVTHKKTTVDVQRGNRDIHATRSSTTVKGRQGKY
jgi:hypothetical protein